MEEQNKPQPVQVSLNENNLGVLTHILGFFTSFIGPLIMYFLYKDTATDKLKMNILNTLNWQISLILYVIISTVLSLIIIGVIGLFILSILNIVFSIIGAVEANKGNVYKYPISINFVKS